MIPPPEMQRALRPFYSLMGRSLQGVTAPGRITSWWRSPSGNALVGGAPRSQHLLGLALDVEGPDLVALYVQLVERWPGTAVLEDDHVHLQLFPAGAIPESVFRAFGV